MDKSLRRMNGRVNMLQLLRYREINTAGSKNLQLHSQFSFELIKRLGIVKELNGHLGCVNCLQWSADGSILASGSDDTDVMIWNPMKKSPLHVLSTKHQGNIFSVKFLGTNNNLIASAAGDSRVTVQTLEGSQILNCSCHSSRVKRLAASIVDPNVFWSAGEDSKILQYDLRESHNCSSQQSNLLLNFGSPYEMKCVAVNPTKPHYLAVGCNDAYVRMYDRRKMWTCLLSEIGDTDMLYPSRSKLTKSNCVQYYAPGHLAVENASITNHRYTVTYIAFNAAGSEMLVNMGGEQLYLFDVNEDKPVEEIRLPSLSRSKATYKMSKCQSKPEECSCYIPDRYREEVNSSKELCACFYMRRGFHLYKRKWLGDLYSAARDYLYVIQNWPHERKAYIGLMKCLVDLGWHEDAKRWYDYLCQLEPDFCYDKQARKLLVAIENVKANPKASDDLDVIKIEEDEIQRRLGSIDHDLRFVGHCNTTTDIMEANFLGQDGKFVCAGSDVGVIFIWERKTQSIINALVGDMSIVNCLQPHPTTCLLASSGIDPMVKLWSPMPENEIENIRTVKKCSSLVQANQHRLVMDPFETLLLNMGYQMQGTFINSERSLQETITELPHCRSS